MFRYTIADTRPFSAELAVPSEEAAWEEALRLVRDIETALRPGETWVLTVDEGESPVFRIRIETTDLRIVKTV